jgi:hypothetical protein
MGKGAEAAAKEKATIEAAADRIIGTVKRHGIHDRQCPACGAERESVEKQWCPGKDDAIGKANQCRVPGHHLHGRCRGCQFGWLEQVRNDEAFTGPVSEIGQGAVS